MREPWNAKHAAGRIMWPSRPNGARYQGIHLLMLWAAPMAKSYAEPT